MKRKKKLRLPHFEDLLMSVLCDKNVFQDLFELELHRMCSSVAYCCGFAWRQIQLLTNQTV